MQYRRFGKTNWQVSVMGYGLWGMGSWSGSSEEESLAALQRAIDLGCNFFDSAYAYGSGTSDRLAGQIIRANPGKTLYFCSKLPPKNYKWPSRRTDTLDDTYPPEWMEEYTLRILGASNLPKIDLLLLHTWEDSWLEDDRLTKSIANLRRQGLIGAFGISLNRWEPWNGLKAVKSGLVDAVQAVHNIFDQDVEDELLPACQQHDVGVIARVPFDEGSLTGTLTLQSTWPEGDFRNFYFTPENLRETIARVEPLKALLPPGMSLPEMALRFILSHPAVGTIIPGMRRVVNVERNMAAADAGPLPADLLAALRPHRWDRSNKQ